MKITGTDLRSMRLRSGRTTKEMAGFAGVKTRKTYENWEKGISAPNVNQYIAMTEGCGYDFAKLVKLISKRQDEFEIVDMTLALAREKRTSATEQGGRTRGQRP